MSDDPVVWELDAIIRDAQEIAPRNVERVAARMAPFLAGLSPAMQGAIMAELTTTWLCGHIIANSPKGTRELRESIFTAYTEMVRELVDLEVARRDGDGQ